MKLLYALKVGYRIISLNIQPVDRLSIHGFLLIRRKRQMDDEIEYIERKPYIPPEILDELELETRAGSPVGVEDFEGQPLIP